MHPELRCAVRAPLQARVQEAVSALADLDEQVADAHAALQAHLAQQLAVQDALRCGLPTLLLSPPPFLPPGAPCLVLGPQ